MIFSKDWHIKYLELAGHISSWSKDPSTKVGSVAVGRVGQILATGYNGFPRGIKDDGRMNVREEKYKLVVHSEMNCIYNATHNGVSLDDATMYVWGLPVCNECAKGIIQVGVRQVVMRANDSTPDKWKDSFENTIKMFEESGVHYMTLNI